MFFNNIDLVFFYVPIFVILNIIYIKGYFLGKYSLSNEYFKAADVSKDNKITAIDYSRVKGYFLEKYNIEQ